MRPDKYLLSFAFFTIFVASGIMFGLDFNSSYAGTGMSNDMTDLLGVNESTNGTGLYSNANIMRTTLFGQDDEGGTTEGNLFSGAYKAIQNIRATFSITNNVTQAIAGTIGLPKIFIDMAFYAIIVMVITSIIYLIFRNVVD